jgi:hypothetical protein
MNFRYCTNCQADRGFKRHLGWGTFFSITLTVVCLIAIIYPIIFLDLRVFNFLPFTLIFAPLGAFFAIVLTTVFWLALIIFYPIRCIACGMALPNQTIKKISILQNILYLIFCIIGISGIFYPLASISKTMFFALRDIFEENYYLLYFLYGLMGVSILLSLLNIFLRKNKYFKIILFLISILIIIFPILGKNQYNISDRLLSEWSSPFPSELESGMIYILIGYGGVIVNAIIDFLLTTLFFKKRLNHK